MTHDYAPHRAPRPAARGWTDRQDLAGIQLVLLALIATVLVIAALDHASIIAVPTVLAVLAAIALAPLARYLQHLRAPASLAAGLIVMGVLLATFFTIYALLPSAEEWSNRAPEIIREVERRIRHIDLSISDAISVVVEPDPVADVPIAPLAPGSVTAEAEPEAPANGEGTLTRLVDGGQSLAADWAISAPGIVAAAVYWAVLTFFLLRDRAMLSRALMGLGPALPSRRALAWAMGDVQSDVAGFLLAITLMNVVLGVLVAGAFYLFGVPNAALWGALAGLLNYMPFIGAAIMAVITLGVGFVTFEDPLVVLSLLGVQVALNTIEGQIVTPMIIGARIKLPTISIFVAIAFGAWLWGAAGALVATPVLIVTVAFAKRLGGARKGRALPRPPATPRR